MGGTADEDLDTSLVNGATLQSDTGNCFEEQQNLSSIPATKLKTEYKPHQDVVLQLLFLAVQQPPCSIQVNDEDLRGVQVGKMQGKHERIDVTLGSLNSVVRLVARRLH